MTEDSDNVEGGVDLKWIPPVTGYFTATFDRKMGLEMVIALRQYTREFEASDDIESFLAVLEDAFPGDLPMTGEDATADQSGDQSEVA